MSDVYPRLFVLFVLDLAIAMGGVRWAWDFDITALVLLSEFFCGNCRTCNMVSWNVFSSSHRDSLC